ncbi:MAG: ATP-binding protein [candidate division KSB1 bacterium]|nr:ATP-binding protein [candidate division KSB1 bacterium]MDZ7365313.1 ATP-binding protein [candidate division KSB1 bacterium]MDZ7403180.1 ATP-binding protein [candidate division KSB1 bacterium]
MKLSLRQRLIITHLFLLVVVTVAAGLIITYQVQQYYKSRLFAQLRTQLDGMEYFLGTTSFSFDHDRLNYEQLAGFARASQMRLTLIDSAGIVLFESNVSPDSLRFIENHLHRPEVQMALQEGIGHDERLSATVKQRLFYVAKRIQLPFKNTGFLARMQVICLAIPLAEVERTLKEMRWSIFAGGGLALLIIGFVSFMVSSRLTMPIRELAKVAESVKRGDTEAHFKHHADDELGELADLLNEMLAKLRQDWQKIQKLETMRSQFLGNVSHELRTPIFAVQGYLETLLEDNVENPQVRKDFIEKAHRQAARLNNLLADLIDISRIESGEMKMSFRYFDLHDWLKKQVAEMQAVAHEYNVALALVNSESRRPLSVLGDRERLAQVMTNLITNAIKYNVPGGKVDVGYRESADHVEIFAADTGRGIPAEHLPRIFERFYRVDKERSRAVGGTGLGLAIVKHIVEAHDSAVKVQSELGKGSIFSFVLKKK